MILPVVLLVGLFLVGVVSRPLGRGFRGSLRVLAGRTALSVREDAITLRYPID